MRIQRVTELIKLGKAVRSVWCKSGYLLLRMMPLTSGAGSVLSIGRNHHEACPPRQPPCPSALRDGGLPYPVMWLRAPRLSTLTCPMETRRRTRAFSRKSRATGIYGSHRASRSVPGAYESRVIREYRSSVRVGIGEKQRLSIRFPTYSKPILNPSCRMSVIRVPASALY